MNSIYLSGHIGKPPELKYTKDDKPVLSFSIAQNLKVKEKEVTEWFNVVVFDKYAETLAVNLESGMFVCIEGRLKINNYENKTGQKRTKVYITAYRVEFVGKKGVAAVSSDSEPVQGNQPLDEDDPF